MKHFFRRNFCKATFALALFGLLVILFFCASLFKQGTPLESNPDVLKGTLPNGLNYRILRNRKPENRIVLRLVVKAGSILEEDDQRGLAHLIEHMAFKSTAHFAEYELVKYFESIGMVFGPDVNAYTTLDETVYRLEIPADKPEFLDTALTIIGDWAWGITFEDEALRKERDVVIEEWRMDRGFSGRVQDKVFPFFFQGSRYADRQTIGDPEIIKNAPKERIVDFYEKWYKTNMLTLVIVGDADPESLESAVKQSLGDIPEGKADRPEYSAPISPEQRSLVITDPESPYPVAQVYEFFPSETLRTRGDFKDRMLRQMAASILGKRLSEKAENGAPFLFADASYYRMIRPLSAASVAFVPKDGQFTEAFKSVLDEIDRYAAFGVTTGEMERQKRDILSGARQEWQNRDKTESSALAASLTTEALYEMPFMHPDTLYELTKAVVAEITQKDVNKAVSAHFGGRGKVLLLTAPENAAIPSQAELEDIWKNYKSESPLERPPEDDSDRPLFEPDSGAKRGRVAGEKTFVLDASGSGRNVTGFTLSNGVEVLLCETDFEADTVYFTAIARGGASLLKDEDSLSAVKAPDYIEFSGLNGFAQAEVSKKLAGTQVSISPQISQSSVSLAGSFAAPDVETYFQLINLYFRAPYFTESAWDRLVSNTLTEIGGRKNDPEAVFIDEVLAYIYSGSLRYVSLNEETVNLLDPAKAERFYREFFKDPAAFTFVFTGDVDKETVKELSETYLGTLPTSYPKVTAREADASVVPAFPRGRKTLTVRKGVENQGEVIIVGGGETPASVAPLPVERELLGLVENLAQIRLREALREKTGAVYSVGVSAVLINYPSRRFMTQVYFGCDPARGEELAALAASELRKLIDEPATDAEIAMLKETFTRQRESARQTNGFWHNTLVRNIAGAQDAAAFATEEAVLGAITPETLRGICKIYLGMENAVTGILAPE